MPKNEDFNYKGISASHSGGWSAQDYHSHQKAHPNKLQETSKEREFKPRPRSKDFNKPKSTTSILDLSTGKRTEVDASIDAAAKKDLKKRNIQH